MNQPIQPTRSSIAFLAVAGLASALLTATATIIGKYDMFFVGFTFGVALAIYFVAYEAYRNKPRLAVFVCACTVAYFAAIFSSFGWGFLFPFEASMGSNRLNIPMPVFFGMGCVGAFIVIAAGVFLFGPRNISWKSVGTILLWSLGGGVLGVLGGEADGIRTHGTYHNFLLVFLIWQPGAAVLLGLVLASEQKAVKVLVESVVPGEGAPEVKTTQSIQVVFIIFFVCVLGFMGFLFYRTFQLRTKLENPFPLAIGLSFLLLAFFPKQLQGQRAAKPHKNQMAARIAFAAVGLALLLLWYSLLQK